MDFNRMWTDFAIAAEYERFGMTRIAAAHNSAIKQRERDKQDAARYRWLAKRENGDLYMENPDKESLDRAIDAAMAKESGNG